MIPWVSLKRKKSAGTFEYLRRFIQQVPRILQPINGYGESFYIDPYNEDEVKKWVKYGVVLTKLRE